MCSGHKEWHSSEYKYCVCVCVCVTNSLNVYLTSEPDKRKTYTSVSSIFQAQNMAK